MQFKQYNKGQKPTRKDFNNLTDEVSQLAGFSFEPPLEMVNTGAGFAVRYAGEYSLLIEITGVSGTSPRKYSWKEVCLDSDGTFRDKPGGVIGSTTHNYALEVGNLSVTTGSRFWATRGQGQYFEFKAGYYGTLQRANGSQSGTFETLRLGPTDAWALSYAGSTADALINYANATTPGIISLDPTLSFPAQQLGSGNKKFGAGLEVVGSIACGGSGIECRNYPSYIGWSGLNTDGTLVSATGTGASYQFRLFNVDGTNTPTGSETYIRHNQPDGGDSSYSSFEIGHTNGTSYGRVSIWSGAGWLYSPNPPDPATSNLIFDIGQYFGSPASTAFTQGYYSNGGILGLMYNAGWINFAGGIVTDFTDPFPIDLTTTVTGVLPEANGGTGQTSVADALDALGGITATI